MTSPFGAAARAHFSLEPGAVFLNHGSFGAVPLPVQRAQTEWRAVMERQPDIFFRRILRPGIRAACEVLGPLIGVSGDEIAFVENATTAISTVLQRMALRPGDEILVTDTTYNAVKLAVADESRRTGAFARSVALPCPYTSDEDVTERVLAGATERTVLAILDHIVSPTAFILPITSMIAGLKARNIRVLVDGAHGPGQLPLNIPALGADWVTGNLHKWLFMPRGTAYFWAGPKVREITLPLNISHDVGQGFPRAFDYTGTRDSTAWLAMPDALSFIAEYGLDRVIAHNSGLARMGAMLFARLGATPIAEAQKFAAMISFFLPTRREAVADDAIWLMTQLWDQHRVQIASSVNAGRMVLRLSAQIYCTPDDFERAAHAIDKLGWPGRA